jgi:RimJ/RimL family protein N-acetyltransferase
MRKLLKSVYQKYGITIRLVEESDAEFIVSLRTNEKLGRFLSQTGSSVEEQRKWIKAYKTREVAGEEYYFIAVGEEGNRYGTTRLYNLEADSFTTGSWLFAEKAPSGMAIKTDLIGRELAFEELGYDICRFDVRKDNKKVIRFHKSFNPRVIKENDLDIYYELDKASFYKFRDKLINII